MLTRKTFGMLVVAGVAACGLVGRGLTQTRTAAATKISAAKKKTADSGRVLTYQDYHKQEFASWPLPLYAQQESITFKTVDREEWVVFKMKAPIPKSIAAKLSFEAYFDNPPLTFSTGMICTLGSVHYPCDPPIVSGEAGLVDAFKDTRLGRAIVRVNGNTVTMHCASRLVGGKHPSAAVIRWMPDELEGIARFSECWVAFPIFDQKLIGRQLGIPSFPDTEPERSAAQ